ncbi:MAG: RdgB/HAM1 family non-canonical purine NTP pyrophosphatase [Planctomycetota bacterium]
MNTKKLLVATANPGKLREVRAILADAEFTLLGLADFDSLPQAVEDADTFEGNAIRKAVHYSKLTGCLTLADDSGLAVDALDGAPGVYSARFAGDDASDQQNNEKLIRLLTGVADEQRTARFCCAMALVDGEHVLATSYATWEGRIVSEARGANGFGYDPYFWVAEFEKTSAELDPSTKNRLSHRGQALAKMRENLVKFLHA